MSRPSERRAGTYRLFADLPSYEQALNTFLAALPFPARGSERVPLQAALGRVLAEPVRPDVDLPPFDRATVDGYAVRAADTAGATPERPAALRWAGDVPAGRWPEGPLPPGAAVSVATGSPLPAGADAVVMVEHAEEAGGTVRVLREVKPGENVLPRGADARAGSVAVPAGRRLRPPDVAAAAAAGAVELRVYRRPRVGIVTTGDELVPPHRLPGPGQIRDANAYGLWAAVLRDGGEPRFAGRVPDRPDALRAALEDLEDCDLVLVSGGSSVGTRDLTLDAVQRLPEARVLVHGVAIRPGKPTLLAVARGGRQAVCGLPGNPVSALVVYELFGRPALLRLAGVEPLPRPAPVRARLVAPVRRPAEREDFVRVALRTAPDGGLLAEPVPGGSGVLQSLVRADALLRVPWEREGFAAGEDVDVLLLPG